MATEVANHKLKQRYRKVRTGVVVSDKMDKTVVVQIERKTMHPTFHKAIRMHKKVQAHDETNECRVGDTVQIVESRPLSKNKCWRVQKLIERAVEEVGV